MKPMIRFKEFNDAWEKRKLGDMMDVTSVKRIHQSDWTNSGIRFLRARDIVSAAKNEEPSDYLYISEKKYNEYSKISGKVSQGDLLVTGVGSIGVPLLITDDNPIYFKDGNIIWFKNEHKIEGNFFYYSFINNKIQKYIRDVAGIGTVGTYTIDSGKKTPISLPTYDEQIKIGSFFKQLDHTIMLYERKLKLLELIKKGLLQKLFVNNNFKYPEIRFKEFNDAWERRRLKDTLSSLKSGLSRKLSDKDIGIPVIRANNIKNGNLIINKNMKYWYEIDPQGANINMYTVKKNDILINFINSDNQIGTSAIVIKDLNRKTIYTTNILKAAVNKHTDPYFWFSLINTEKYYADIATITKPAINQSSFTTKDFKELTYYFPKLEEQKKIGVTIKQINDLISLYQRKIDLLETLKQEFLKNMLI